jgi:hypothetical protein
MDRVSPLRTIHDLSLAKRVVPTRPFTPHKIDLPGANCNRLEQRAQVSDQFTP